MMQCNILGDDQPFKGTCHLHLRGGSESSWDVVRL
jgi:hypothetical protein